MKATAPVSERHLSLDGLDKFLRSGVPILHPIAGQPVVSLFIDPAIPEMGLRVYNPTGERLSPTNLRHVLTRAIHHNARLCLEVVITAPELFRDAYPLLCATADRIQLDKLRPAEALGLTLRKLSSLLRPGDLLPVEREVGLFGELLTLAGLIDVVGTAQAMDAWRGGDSEEHDFGLREVDVEVKTTTSERRVHWIESLTQLVETGDRPLWLVSHQLTSAGVGDGLRLPELISLVRRIVGEGGPRDALEAGLIGARWVDDFEDRCITRWTRRTPSRAYAVVSDFPRLTPDSLANAGISLAHVPEVKYRIDLSGLSNSDTPPEALQAAIRFEGRR
jgi:Putative  PD-(D/E)XK family member, (DUF4420)